VATLAASYAVTANRTDVAQAQASERDVKIIRDGGTHHVRTAQTTVGATLKDAGVEIGPADLVYPKPNVRVYNGMTIKIVRVVDKVVSEDQPIAFAVKHQPTAKLRMGMKEVASEGQQGLKRLYYQARYVDGVEKRRELVRAEVVTQPKDKVILFGDYGKGIASRGAFTSRRVLIMHASAYDPGPRSCGGSADGITCTGMKAGYGVVAVDPRVIKLGTRLYVEGYGYAIAGDVGRAIKGHRIDLGYDTYYSAKRFGRKRVTVHILE
jgi:3D (Asp-Asp-Asp) domain-containing protein